MSTPAIAPRAPDHTLDATARAAESSCCSILIKTALTVAVVAAAAIALTVTLACASPLVGLVVLCVAVSLTGIFLSAAWAGTTTHVPYSPHRHYVSVPVRDPSPLFWGVAPRPLFTESASASRFGPPAAAAFADRPFEAAWGLPRRGAAALPTAVGVGGFGGVVLPMSADRAAPLGGHVAVGGRR